jgi:ribosomal protein L12E/L44/L45/RPP1/RPP2
MTKIALVLAIAAIGEGAVTLHLVRQLHVERENAQVLQARVTELEQGSPQGSPAGATFVAVPTQQVTNPFTAGSAKPAPAPSQQAIAGSFAMVNSFGVGRALPAPDHAQLREQMNASMERQRTLMKDPEYREAMHAQQKMMLMRSNPNVARDLDLSPEQMDQLFGTLAEQQVRGMENMNAFQWSEQTDPAKMQEMNRKATEQVRANEAELKRALGETKYREWQEYQALSGVRWEADRVRASLASAGVPLDDNLVKPLLKSLQEQQQKMIEQMTANVAAANAAAANAPAQGQIVARAGFITEPNSNDVLEMQRKSMEYMAQNQRRQRDALARVLSPEQVKIIEEEQEAELQMQRAQLRIMQAQKDAGLLDPSQTGAAVGYFEQGVTFAPPVSD